MWHVYKHAATAVFRLAANAFMAPLFHLMFPGSPFYWTPKLRLVTFFFHVTRLAYPSVRDDLTEALKKLPAQSNEGIYARNLYFLFEYLIPTVRPSS